MITETEKLKKLKLKKIHKLNYTACGSAKQKYDICLEKRKVKRTQAVTAQKKKRSFWFDVEQLKKEKEVGDWQRITVCCYR